MTPEDTGIARESRVRGASLRLPAVRRGRRPSAILFRQSAFDGGSHLFHQTIPADEILRVNPRMKNHFCPAWSDGEPRLRHGEMRPHDRDRNYRSPALHGQIERAFFEGEQLAVE